MVDHRRGKNVAILGVFLQIVLTAVTIAVWRLTGAHSALACGLFAVGGVGLWVLVLLLFYCGQLERQEAAEMDELAAEGGTGRIFEDQLAEERPAAVRLRFIRRWLVPIFTLLWAGYHAAVAVLIFRYLADRSPVELAVPSRAALFLLVVAFPGFLFSRYATGMSRGRAWRLLRPAGSYLLMNVLFLAATIAAFLFAWQGNFTVDLVTAYVFAGVQIVFAVELMINFVLELYRPRIPGQEDRPSFDSRLFGLVAEPERVGHSIAETLNYQFGFEVSRTWFYQLLGKAIVPLLIFGVLSLFAMSSVVIVREGQQAVVLRWGRFDEARGTLRPGLHFKWPWPIDTAEYFRTDEIHEILLGAGRKRTEKERITAGEIIPEKNRELFLWGKVHGVREELDFLIAVPPPTRGDNDRTDTKTRNEKGEKPTPSVHIIKLVVSVQYRISDVGKFAFRYADAAKLLEAVAYREMTLYCCSATLDTPVSESSDRPGAIMTVGRSAAAKALKERIKLAVGDRTGMEGRDLPADEKGLDLGVEITYVGLVSAHPPARAAEAYSRVLEEERGMVTRRYEAQAKADKILIGVAGDSQLALKLAAAIEKLQEVESKQQDGASEERMRDLAERISNAREEIHELFGRATGQVAALIAQAEAYRWSKALAERSRAVAFDREILAYNASPAMYTLDRYLGVLDEVLPGILKHVLAVDRDKIELWVNREEMLDSTATPFDQPESAEE